MAKKLTTQQKARRMWVKALRSGKYTQGQGQLKTTDEYCCLGVLCDLAVKHGIIRSFNPGDPDLDHYPEVMNWVGLTGPMGDFTKRNGRTDDLASLNDGTLPHTRKTSFKKIADVIESEPQGLFVKLTEAE